MDKSQAILLELLSRSINGKGAEDFLVDKINQELYQKISTYSCKGILYPTASKLSYGNSEAQNIYKDWTTYINKRLMPNLLFIQQISYIISVFKQASLNPIIIKGLAISRFYQYPEYRFMEDLDLFIYPSEWEDAKKILSINGYVQEDDDDYHPMHVKFVKRGHIPIELHSHLIHSGYLGERATEEWYQHIWLNKNSLSWEGIEFNALCPSDELINQIIHFAAHFTYYGTRLKHLYEMALIIKSNESNLDWMYIAETLKTMEFYEFGNLLFCVIKKFFGINIPELYYTMDKKTVEKFMSNFLDYFSTERLPTINGYLQILNRYRNIYKYPHLFQLIIWAIAMRSQYKVHGFDLNYFGAIVKNIKHINRKIYVIRRLKLIPLQSITSHLNKPGNDRNKCN